MLRRLHYLHEGIFIVKVVSLYKQLILDGNSEVTPRFQMSTSPLYRQKNSILKVSTYFRPFKKT